MPIPVRVLEATLCYEDGLGVHTAASGPVCSIREYYLHLSHGGERPYHTHGAAVVSQQEVLEDRRVASMAASVDLDRPRRGAGEVFDEPAQFERDRSTIACSRPSFLIASISRAKAATKGVGQDARSNRTWVAPSRKGCFVIP